MADLVWVGNVLLPRWVPFVALFGPIVMAFIVMATLKTIKGQW